VLLQPRLGDGRPRHVIDPHARSDLEIGYLLSGDYVEIGKQRNARPLVPPHQVGIPAGPEVPNMGRRKLFLFWMSELPL
jgi:hypothetical protein